MTASDHLNPDEFQYQPVVPGLNTSQSEAVRRFQTSRTASVGGEIVKVSKGLRSKLREAESIDDVKSWGRIDEPGVKPASIEGAAQKYGLMGPHDSLGRTLLRAYGDKR